MKRLLIKISLIAALITFVSAIIPGVRTPQLPLTYKYTTIAVKPREPDCEHNCTRLQYLPDCGPNGPAKIDNGLPFSYISYTQNANCLQIERTFAFSALAFALDVLLWFGIVLLTLRFAFRRRYEQELLRVATSDSQPLPAPAPAPTAPIAPKPPSVRGILSLFLVAGIALGWILSTSLIGIIAIIHDRLGLDAPATSYAIPVLVALALAVAFATLILLGTPKLARFSPDLAKRAVLIVLVPAAVSGLFGIRGIVNAVQLGYADLPKAINFPLEAFVMTIAYIIAIGCAVKLIISCRKYGQQ